MEKLTDDQLRTLNEIAKLPDDQQQQRLREFMSTLSGEQIEYLKAQQEQNCPFCSIIQGEILSQKLYEDEKVVCVLDINPANPGHFIVFPKTHLKSSYEMGFEEFGYLMNITNVVSKMMNSLLKAEGSNIIINNGVVAGQRTEHFLVHCIPRFKDDNINFVWKSKKIGKDVTDRILREFSNLKIHKKDENKKKENTNITYDFNEERIP